MERTKVAFLSIFFLFILFSCTRNVKDIDIYGKSVSEEYNRWIYTGEYKVWQKNPNTPHASVISLSQDCEVFSKIKKPKEVVSCIQSPGSSDWPTIYLELSDGSTRSYPIYLNRY